jgi:glycerophosphoryl diester phosphodiesterase
VPGIDFQAMQSDRGLAEIADYADGIGPWIPQLFEPDGTTPGELVQNAHHHGLLVHTYTLRADNLEAGFQTFDALQEGVFIRAGVDGAFSDFSDLTRRFIDGMDR